jgi:hypothetical protein
LPIVASEEKCNFEEKENLFGAMLNKAKDTNK